jgi:protocatechuate 3,4-dioxygenase beta subunit
LTGVVTDQNGALIVNADVEIKDNSKGTTQSCKTDREGVYQFFFVAPGRYTLMVTHQSFRPESRTVNVLLGPPVTVNVSLHHFPRIVIRWEYPFSRMPYRGDPSFS